MLLLIGTVVCLLATCGPCVTQGSAFFYNDYALFPIKKPRLWVWENNTVGGVLVPMKPGSSILVDAPYEIYVLARFTREVCAPVFPLGPAPTRRSIVLPRHTRQHHSSPVRPP